MARRASALPAGVVQLSGQHEQLPERSSSAYVPGSFGSPVGFGSPQCLSPASPTAPSGREWHWSYTWHCLKSIEYEPFAMAEAQCRLLLRRVHVLVGQITLDRPEPPLLLRCTLRGALALLEECRPSFNLSHRILSACVGAHWFQGCYTRIRRAWAMTAPGWEVEDRAAAQKDLQKALEVLSALPSRPEWGELKGSSDLWPMLEAMRDSQPEREKVAAKLQRHHWHIDFADVHPTDSPVEGANCIVQPAVYRGAPVALKTVRPKLLQAATVQDCMMRAQAWLRVVHPNIVPVVGVAVATQPSGAGEALPSDCATVATRVVPGISLYHLLYDSGDGRCSGAAGARVVRDVVEGLCCAQAVEVEAEALAVNEIHPTNVMVDSPSGTARFILPMVVHAAEESRWRAPHGVPVPECYCAGLLLWATLTAGQPMRHALTQDQVSSALRSGSWRPVAPADCHPQLAHIIRRSAARGGRGEHDAPYRSLVDMLADLEAAIAVLPAPPRQGRARAHTAPGSPPAGRGYFSPPRTKPLPAQVDTEAPETGDPDTSG
eukprot:TRINITY_DN13160_c0_g1_i1.p1 TRINITY_DN13160_c0_g1~~TRINITY_DN13160_c0_g1_i1.p1  ORF type:complete len:547 (+),score=108.35 TRINITY_DN13160_c0_g1_i1:75-1715(+)